jgi:tRNA (guanine26-N2/guanine27-N2)-dimethyltransferase
MNFNYPTEIVTEGSIHICVPKLGIYGVKGYRGPSIKAPVFYNPKMSLNRDLAIVVLLAHYKSVNKKLRVCEPMTGTGVRGLRFAALSEAVMEVVLGDLNPHAVNLTTYNLAQLDLSSRALVYNMDANTLLSLHSAPSKRFDYVDIDPFGSPTPFIDSAIRALRNGGVIALTATDLGPLCGVHPKSCLRKYYSKPLKTEYSHELALRILIGTLVAIAARFEYGVSILFSYYADHYIRVYAKLEKGLAKVDESLNRMGFIRHCFRCMYRNYEYGLFKVKNLKCFSCEGSVSIAGPLWLGEISDWEFCESMIDQIDIEKLSQRKLAGKLIWNIIREVKMPPTYYRIDQLCDNMGVPTPPKRIVIKNIVTQGFNVTGTHFSPRGIKTNAPLEVMRDAILEGLKASQSVKNIE